MNLAEIAKVVADEKAATALVERIVWPTGPVCPHCGSVKFYDLSKTRLGLRKCAEKECRKQFTVRIGTIFEDSHIPLSKWLLAIHLMCSSKKGMSAKQLERELGISYKSAWFLCHRIRLAMAQPPLRGMLGGGSVNKVVEIDETYIGGKPENNLRKQAIAKQARAAGLPNPFPKPIVMTLVERGGYVRSFPVPNATKETLQPIARMNISGTAHIVTDELRAYKGLSRSFRSHGTVTHSKKEFVRGVLHVNFAESYHSLLKRGIVGTFHHISEKHLERYLREFEFRWNTRTFTDGERTEKAIRETKGKRLTYKPLLQK
jgi:transposase-like protein